MSGYHSITPMSQMNPESENPAPLWTIWFKTRRVEKSWQELGERVPESLDRCEKWLKHRPMERLPGRVFPLIGKRFKGAWEYEVTGADRVFYIPDSDVKTVMVYYAGKHVKPAPIPG